jgi:hypothetical protein
MLDAAVNSAAGAAAAATGASVNGNAVTSRCVKLGAIAGLVKSAWHSMTSLIGWPNPHPVYGLFIIAGTNDLVFAELLVVAISAITIGESEYSDHAYDITIPAGFAYVKYSWASWLTISHKPVRGSLCVGALAAALPLHFEFVRHLACEHPCSQIMHWRRIHQLTTGVGTVRPTILPPMPTDPP